MSVAATAMPPSVPPLGAEEARRLSDVAARLAGVRIPPERRDFLATRAMRRLRALGCDSFADYMAALEADPGEARLLMEQMTTHTTAFFREPAHFDWLRAEGLPALAAAGVGRTRPVDVWSAACSTGAELWTAGMVVEDAARALGLTLGWRGLGTDVSGAAVRRAERAVFDGQEIAGLPEEMRRRHLLRGRPGAGAPLFRIAPELRARARFRVANLMALDREPKIEADIAFLRNVLIYFSAPDQMRVARAVLARVRPGGFLITGHAESLGAEALGAACVGPSIYRRN